MTLHHSILFEADNIIVENDPDVCSSWVLSTVHAHLQQGGLFGFQQRQDPAAFAAFDRARAGRLGNGPPPPPAPGTPKGKCEDAE